MPIRHTGVAFLNKLKIHELAKELNVTSKRLMEKLEEIGIHPKSHMTTLEDDELDKLYKHIGIVNRDNKASSSAQSESDGRSDHAESVVKKNAPRIIRKTEVVFRDETIHEEHKDKKKNDRKGYIRSSDSNDGLMAGFTRGRDNNIIAGIKKRSRDDDNRPAEDKETEKPDIIESIQLSDKVKKPVDDILSIKKVSHISEKTENQPDHTEVIKQETMQKEDIITQVKPHSKPAAEDTAAVSDQSDKGQTARATDIRLENTAETAQAEVSQETIKPESKPVAQENTHKAQRSDKPASAAQGDRMSGNRSDRPQDQDNRQERPRFDGSDRRPQGDFQRRPQGDYQNRPQGDFQRRPQGDYQNRPQGDFQRRPGGDYQNRPQGDFQRRPQGDYQNRPQGDFQRRPQGDYQNRPQGDFQRRGDGQPRGEWKPREGGQPRGDWKPGEGRPYGDRPPQGDRPPFRGNRDGDNRYGDRRGGDRGPGGRDRQLVIPKVAAPAGATEEKVFTRGERREFTVVEKQREEKKEQKKEAVRATPAAQDKSGRFKKKIDIVGHKASVSDMMSDDFVIDVFYDDAEEAINVKRAERKLKKGKVEKEKYIPPKAVLTDITIPESITVKELAEALKKTVADVIKKLFVMGIAATQNQVLDFDTAAILGDEYNVKVHKAVVVSAEDILFDDTEDDEADLEPRPPVVVVMGHVDHGKTSLLDAIRSANIAEHEAGGITQHIGAYTVNLHGRDITFLDTPGHEAFTAMRARGAQVTDIAILVVAADDGVMPQTIEAINHAKAAGVSIIVAINKIDKPNANPDRLKQELTEHGLLIEEWGGDVIAVPVSAKKRENIDQLLEMVLLTADILELKANPKRQAKGTIIEAQLDKNKGPVATLLVQRGTLRVGDAILSGSTFGRVRAMVNDKGRKIKEAGPSVPVEITGLSDVPEAGDLFYVVTDEKVAKGLAEKRKQESHEKSISRTKVSLEDLFSQIKEGHVKDLNLIIKADVQGSVEAIKQSMEKLSNDEVKVKVIHGGVGAIIEADVRLAEVSNAIIIGFNVRPAVNVLEMAQNAGVDLRMYRIIYDALEDIEKAMKGMLKPTFKEVVDGHAEIRQLFKVSSMGTIGGSYVTDGKISRNSDIRLVRNGIVILEGKLASLKRFKDDVKEVAAGYECGIMIERFNDIKEGDVVEAYHMEEVARQ